MRFNKNHKFKIMQITDMQEIPAISQDTLDLLNAALEAEKPDLVVYTGDQIKGYGVTYKGKSREELKKAVSGVIKRLLEPVTKRGIPFAVTFGNHDPQVGIPLEEQLSDIYAKLPGFAGPQENNPPCAGTYNIPLKSSGGTDADMANIYLFYSGTDAKGGGYEPFLKENIEWYRKVRDELEKKNGNYVKSIVFQHIPLPEYYDALKRVKKGTKNSIRAFRTHKNEFYTLPENHKDGDMLNEPPSIPNENTGEFGALSEKGDVFAVYAGHDHKNSFTVKYKGIDLGYTQSSGFNCYGAREKRGVRVFVLDENKPEEYETYTRTFDELLRRRVRRPVADFISFYSPETIDAAILMIAKILILILGIAAVIVFCVKLEFVPAMLVSLLTIFICVILFKII